MSAAVLNRTPMALMIVAALFLAACDSPEDRAEKHFQRGVEIAAENEPSKARLEFRNALRLNPQHVGAHFEMASYAEENQNWRRAISGFRRVAELDPAHVEARIRLARILLAADELVEAEALLTEASALSQDDVELLTTRATLRFRQGDQTGALEDAQAALAIDPDHPGANLLVLTDLATREDPAAALAALDALLERTPRERGLRIFRLRLLELLDRPDAIVAELRLMADLYPDEPTLRRSLVDLLLRRGEVEAAEVEIRKLAADDPSDVNRGLDLVRFVASARGPEAARAELERLIAEAPQDGGAMDYRFALVELELSLERNDAARVLLEAAIADAADDAVADRARVRLAQLDLDEKRPDAALAAAEAVLARDPDNVGALSVRARLHIDALRLDEAILDLRRAQSGAPNDVALLIMEAEAHQLDGNAALAEERLASAARVSDFAPEPTLRYAAFLRSQGQLSAAAAALQEAERRQPTDRAVLAALAQMRLDQNDLDGARTVENRLRQLEGGDTLADAVAVAALSREGEYQASADILERLVLERRTTGDALRNLIAAYVRSGDAEKAIEVLDDILARDPVNVSATALRAELELQRGDPEAALARLEALAAAAPENPTTHLTLARLHVVMGRAEAAEATARAGLAAASDPDEPGAQGLRLLLASLLESRGDFDGAIAEYRALYDALPNAVVVANNLASLLAEHRADDPEALAFAERVARRLRDSPVPEFLDTYGWIAFLRGDVDRALASLIRAAEMLPDNALVQYHLGRAYAAADRPQDARRLLRTALEVDPNFAKAASAQEALSALDAAPAPAAPASDGG